MPYSSFAQQSYFNTNRRKLGNAVVDKFNAESKGVTNLPQKVDDDPKKAEKLRRYNRMTGKK